ncbi:auxilin-like protein 1 [Tanacetum coccineum]
MMGPLFNYRSRPPNSFVDPVDNTDSRTILSVHPTDTTASFSAIGSSSFLPLKIWMSKKRYQILKQLKKFDNEKFGATKSEFDLGNNLGVIARFLPRNSWKLSLLLPMTASSCVALYDANHHRATRLAKVFLARYCKSFIRTGKMFKVGGFEFVNISDVVKLLTINEAVNLRANSGWQSVSLTEIITTTAVKKTYIKATVFVHPDKLQQRGASIQQKYICEKIFDLLKLCLCSHSSSWDGHGASFEVLQIRI